MQIAPEKTTRAKKFEIAAATSHDRIQKNKNTALLLQLIPASTSVIKKVTMQLRITIFMLLPLLCGLIKVDNLRTKLFIKNIVFAHIKV